MNTKTTLSLLLVLITFSFMAIDVTNGWFIGKEFWDQITKMVKDCPKVYCFSGINCDCKPPIG